VTGGNAHASRLYRDRSLTLAPPNRDPSRRNVAAGKRRADRRLPTVAYPPLICARLGFAIRRTQSVDDPPVVDLIEVSSRQSAVSGTAES